MTTATTAADNAISIRVSGRRQYISAVRRGLQSFLQHHAAHLPYGQEDAERQDQHEHTESDGDDRLDARGEIPDFVVHFALVHVGDLAEQAVELASFLADRDHLQNYRCKDARCDRGTQHALATLHTFAHLFDPAR